LSKPSIGDVIATMWKVNDAAAGMMAEAFYDHFAKGEGEDSGQRHLDAAGALYNATIQYQNRPQQREDALY
jgi:hypothetical protein